MGLLFQMCELVGDYIVSIIEVGDQKHFKKSTSFISHDAWCYNRSFIGHLVNEHNRGIPERFGGFI